MIDITVKEIKENKNFRIKYKRVLHLFSYFSDNSNVRDCYISSLKNGFVEFPSVFSKNKVSCIASFYSERNILLFNDRGKIFAVIQSRFFVFAIILIDEKVVISRTKGRFKSIYNKTISFIKNSKNEIFKNEDERGRFLGIINNYTSPYYYFYDRVFWLEYLALPIDKFTIYNGLNAFLDISKIYRSRDSKSYSDIENRVSGVCLDLGGGWLKERSQAVSDVLWDVSRKVVNYFVSYNKSKVLAKYTIFDGRVFIWLGISLEKRNPENFLKTLSNFIDLTYERYNNPVFILDALTSPLGMETSKFRDKYCKEELLLKEKLQNKYSHLDFIDIIGAKAEDKIFLANKTDLFFSNAGTDSIWCSAFSRKKGVVYSSNFIRAKKDHLHWDSFFLNKSIEVLSAEGNYSVDRFSFNLNYFNDEIKSYFKELDFENKGCILADEKDYKIVLFDNKSSITLVCFNGNASTKSSPPFGRDYSIKNKYNYIAVLQDNDTQYQSLSGEKLRDITKPFLKGRVFTYGSSLGGYCALYYASFLESNVIACAPKNSAHPDTLDKSRYSSLNFLHDREFNKNGVKKVFVIYDPKRKSDRMFVEDKVSPIFFDAHLYELPFSGHAVLHYIKATGVLSDFLNKIINQHDFINVPVHHENSIYLKNKFYYYLNRKEFELSKKVMIRAKGKLREDMEKKLLKKTSKLI